MKMSALKETCTVYFMQGDTGSLLSDRFDILIFKAEIFFLNRLENSITVNLSVLHIEILPRFVGV